MMRHLLLGLLFISTLAPIVSAQGRKGPADGPSGPDPSAGPGNPEIRQKLREQVPMETMFRDEQGNNVTLASVALPSRPIILVPAYLGCQHLCNSVIDGVCEAAKQLAKDHNLIAGVDYTIVVFSFDPKEKPAQALAYQRRWVTEYGRKEGEQGWRFLTGPQESIDQVCDAVGYERFYDTSIKEYKHSAGIILLTPSGVVSRYFMGHTFIDIDENAIAEKKTVKNLKLALIEAGEGKIGSLADRFVLSCYRYDMYKGKYAFEVLTAVKIGGALTLALIVIVYAIVLLRNRFRKVSNQDNTVTT